MLENDKALAFSGKNFPAWSTGLTSYLQTKDLYRARVGEETEPGEVAALAVGAEEDLRRISNGTEA